MDDPRPPGNIPEYTVTEISGAVKRTLETAFSRIRVRGEITELKRYPSGHIYFSLKDDAGKLSGVVWKNAVAKLGLVPENGVEVIAQGRISSYGERSSYQLIVERMEYAGAGALLARIEMLRLRLAAEGLFDADRKRALPMLPGVIGVVTSERGAVIQDIRITISRRFPRRIILWPVPVQGPDAATQIAEAIMGFDGILAGGPIPRPDVLIVARGGGGLEDLMAFNDEAVIRAVAGCSIPLISAVGHETDTTLIDFVSDRRAPTPTAAAEMAVPQRSELLADLLQKAARIAGALNRINQELYLRLQRAERGLPDLPSLVGSAQQRLDDRSTRHLLAMRSLMQAARGAVQAYRKALPDPHNLVQTARQTLADRHVRLSLGLPNLVHAKRAALLRVAAAMPAMDASLGGRRAVMQMVSQTLAGALRQVIARHAATAARVTPRLGLTLITGRIRQSRTEIDSLGLRLESLSYQKVLERGFVLVTTQTGKPIAKAAFVRPGSELQLHFGDGIVVAKSARPKREPQLPLL